jgi:very-short-patch-repair endonuclease
MPLAEVILWSRIKGKQLEGFKFRRQYSVDNFIIDFYCPALKFGIEVDGDSHFTEKTILSDKKRHHHIEA